MNVSKLSVLEVGAGNDGGERDGLQHADRLGLTMDHHTSQRQTLGLSICISRTNID